MNPKRGEIWLVDLTKNKQEVSTFYKVEMNCLVHGAIHSHEAKLLRMTTIPSLRSTRLHSRGSTYGFPTISLSCGEYR